jgi:hypothetical protein
MADWEDWVVDFTPIPVTSEWDERMIGILGKSRRNPVTEILYRLQLGKFYFIE